MLDMKEQAIKWDELNRNGLSFSKIAKQFGTTKSAVSGAIWRHVRAPEKYQEQLRKYHLAKESSIPQEAG